MDWLQFFPHETPRYEQIQALDFIIDSFVKHDCAIVELGTGVGKSAVAVTLGRWFAAQDQLSQTYVVTSQKILQDQYLNDFSPLTTDIRSSANFSCSWFGQTCAETLRIKRALQTKAGCDQHSCQYHQTKETFKKSLVGVTNYSYLLSETVYAGGLGPRKLLVLDEAHNIESEVRKWATISIKGKFATSELSLQMPRQSDGDGTLLSWLESQYVPSLQQLIARTLNRINKIVGSGLVSPELKLLSKKHELLDKHVCQINRYLQEKGGSRDNYIVVWDEADHSASIKPLDVAKQARTLLYSLGDKKLLMSATILDKGVFTRAVGLPKNVPFLSLPSPFSKKAFGVSYKPVGQMSRKHAQDSLPKLVAEIKNILNSHPNDKGIIHSTSYAVTKALAQINNDRLLVQETSTDRDRLLQEHLSSPRPTVLVSPGMIEGLDLRDDLGRFQVICKVPYPYLGDRVIWLKKEKDPKWYDWCTIRTLVQSIGRCVRNQDDWAKTYILDECFLSLLTRRPEMFPSYFEELETYPL